MYGDQNRSPGRDDRHDDGGPRHAPWDVGNGPAPANDDVKVAGSPNIPPGFYDAGVHATTAMSGQGEAGARTPGYQPGGPGGPGAGAPGDGNATGTDDTAHDLPAYDTAAYDSGSSPYGEGAAYETGTPSHEAGATSAMPPYADEPPLTGSPAARMRRTPPTGNKRVIRFAAVAAAVAVVGGGGVAWAVTSGSSGGKGGVSQQAQANPSVPAPLTDAQRKKAEDQRRKELKKRASRAARDEVSRPRLLARGTPPPTKKPDTAAGTAGDPVPAGEAQKIARAMLSDFGWSPSSQFGCLVNLWNKESHWNTHASNPSGAYGIPQALPGSKMSSAGPDWQNNASTQIKWGMGYIRDRYSSPCGAWAHSQSTGWY